MKENYGLEKLNLTLFQKSPTTFFSGFYRPFLRINLIKQKQRDFSNIFLQLQY
jgi:hypothetical protein